MPKKIRDELTVTFANVPSKKAIKAYTEFMFQMYMKGKIKIPQQKKQSNHLENKLSCQNRTSIL